MNKFFATLLAIFAVTTVNAQETSNQSTVKASDVAPAEKPQEDIDAEITNKKLRAELGSKSKWSIKTAFSYSGASIERPFQQIRPNYRAGAEVPALTSISGSVGVKYAITNRDSLSLGTGLSVINPFHGDMTRGEFEDPRFRGQNRDRFEVSTPSLSYTRAYKVGEMQMISDVSYSHYTDSESVRGMNGVGSVGVGQTILADLGTSSWSAGVSFLASKAIWKGAVAPEFAAEGARQMDYVYGLFPFAEYTFNDNFSFRTVFGYFQNVKYRGVGADGSVTSLAPYQSVGLGMSVSRDIYLYPNVQFTPLDMRADRTNIGLSANLNMF
ncbi:MAG: hypothetical protein KF789_03785 [Bdellovibrionaceae bacterium]|nr:hypothetical protein [Pseudobdellovibrionaceae bacterium]